jgi:hypothetical protein
MAPSKTKWKIHRAGRRWNDDEFFDRYNSAPGRLESMDHKLCCTDEERINLLGMLLENMGADAAVRLGDPAVWRAAIAALDDDD